MTPLSSDELSTVGASAFGAALLCSAIGALVGLKRKGFDSALFGGCLGFGVPLLLGALRMVAGQQPLPAAAVGLFGAFPVFFAVGWRQMSAPARSPAPPLFPSIAGVPTRVSSVLFVVSMGVVPVAQSLGWVTLETGPSAGVTFIAVGVSCMLMGAATFIDGARDAVWWAILPTGGLFFVALGWFAMQLTPG